METEVRVQLARHANDHMCDRLAEADWEEPIAFFCECGAERCFRTVWLTASNYAERRTTNGWRALAETHDDGPSVVPWSPPAAPQPDRLRHEFLCDDCGFGSIRAVPPTRCPMCGGDDWRSGLGGSRVLVRVPDGPRDGAVQAAPPDGPVRWPAG